MNRYSSGTYGATASRMNGTPLVARSRRTPNRNAKIVAHARATGLCFRGNAPYPVTCQVTVMSGAPVTWITRLSAVPAGGLPLVNSPVFIVSTMLRDMPASLAANWPANPHGCVVATPSPPGLVYAIDGQ